MTFCESDTVEKKKKRKEKLRLAFMVWAPDSLWSVMKRTSVWTVQGFMGVKCCYMAM